MSLLGKRSQPHADYACTMGCKSSKTDVREPSANTEGAASERPGSGACLRPHSDAALASGRRPVRPKPGYTADDATMAAGDGLEPIDPIVQTVSHVLSRIVMSLSLDEHLPALRNHESTGGLSAPA